MRLEFYMNNFEYLGSSMVNNDKHQYYKILNEDNLEILHVIIKNDVILNFFRRENNELILEFSFTIQKDSKSSTVQYFLTNINNTIDVFYKDDSNLDIILKEIKRKNKIEKILLLDYYNYSNYLYEEILLIMKSSTDIDRIKYLCYLIENIKENNVTYKSSNTKPKFIESYKTLIKDEIIEGLKDCYKDNLDVIAHIKTYNNILRKKKIEKLLK